MRDRITPEFPRAPRSIPREATDEASDSESESLSRSMRAPDSIVINILSPVSPSGIGNTLRSFTAVLFDERFAAPDTIMSAKVDPSI